MTDRTRAIASLIRENRKADPDALLCMIISRWPDVTGEEMQKAIDASRAKPLLVLATRPQEVEQA